MTPRHFSTTTSRGRSDDWRPPNCSASREFRPLLAGRLERDQQQMQGGLRSLQQGETMLKIFQAFKEGFNEGWQQFWLPFKQLWSRIVARRR